jgi:hypothetical protein
MNLTKNVGPQDAKFRYAAGGLLILAAIFTKSWLLGIIGLIAVGTAYMGTCLAYLPFGIDTTKEGGDKG